MSRLFIASLLALTSSLAFADQAPHFAQPPHAVQADVAVALDRDHVRAALRLERQHNLEAFRAYVTAGTYPSNVYQSGELNVWRDQGGHYCAAATIIKQSGQTELVAKVAEQNNFIRLADVSQGPLMDWILTSGLTQDEIVLIQRPFRPVTQTPEVAPTTLVAVDAKLRQAEDARLRTKYAAIVAKLDKQANASLDAATERLMKHPTLAWDLISR